MIAERPASRALTGILAAIAVVPLICVAGSPASAAPDVSRTAKKIDHGVAGAVVSAATIRFPCRKTPGGSGQPCDQTIANDYPFKARKTGADQWNFLSSQCTSFVAWRVRERMGVRLANHFKGILWGDAKNWANAARATGVRVNRKPAVGAVAQWTGGRYGHVAYVSRVNGNGTIVIEEYNWFGEKEYNTRTIRARKVKSFIHL